MHCTVVENKYFVRLYVRDVKYLDLLLLHSEVGPCGESPFPCSTSHYHLVLRAVNNLSLYSLHCNNAVTITNNKAVTIACN